MTVLRRLGFRTRKEIEEEKRALVHLLEVPAVEESLVVIEAD